MVPKFIYASVFGLHFEVEIIRFAPGIEDRSNLDLAVVHEKRHGQFIRPRTSEALDFGRLP
jgi:hypothetical protein